MIHRLILFCVLAAFALLTHAEDSDFVYKWHDDTGQVHYTQLPPADREAERIPRATAPPGATAEPASNDLQQRLEALDEQQQEAAKQQEDAGMEAEIKKIRKRNCEAARQNLINLQRGGNIRYRTADGQVYRLSEEERQEKSTEATKQIEENCDSSL